MSSNPSPTLQLVPNFVKKLLSILNDKPNSASVKWMPDGNGFKIINEHKFTSQVLPKYYRHANMPSFVRQLNMYGFHKIKDGEENFYKHPNFKKDQPELYPSISRKPEKKNIISEYQNSSEKENIQDDKRWIRKKINKKKISFAPEVDLKEDDTGKNLNKTKKELISNVSLKFNQTNRNLNNLLDQKVTPPQQMWRNDDDDDKVSICDNMEEIAQIPQFFNSSRRIIFYTPSDMLLNLN